MLEPILLLVFVNNIPDAISSRLGICADDITNYSCLNFLDFLSDQMKLAIDPKIMIINLLLLGAKNDLLNKNDCCIVLRESVLPSICMTDPNLEELSLLTLLRKNVFHRHEEELIFPLNQLLSPQLVGLQ